jgi:hypothetical protein
MGRRRRRHALGAPHRLLAAVFRRRADRIAPLSAGGTHPVSRYRHDQRRGEEIFLFACTVIAALAFRPHERLVMLCVAALPLGVHLALAGHYPIPPHIYTPAQYAKLRSMNVISVTMLIILVGMVFSNARARLETTRV